MLKSHLTQVKINNPFYIIYNRNVPEGLVLPEILSQMEFENILKSISTIPSSNN